MKKRVNFSLLVVFLFASFLNFTKSEASYHFSNFKGVPPIHEFGSKSKMPIGMTPEKIKNIYGLPQTGGVGTIVIVGAYDDKTIEHDLKIFSQTFNLPTCDSTSGCFVQHKMSNKISTNSGWAMEISLDVEWAHAIAPNAKIILVEATTPSGKNLLAAVDYAASVKDATAISMSWGGAEFPEETNLDSHFKSVSGATFFASSGDNGTGASWPASSPNVVGVGGTKINLTADGKFSSETAWAGSGGGISAYEKQPDFQKTLTITKAGGMRAIPDVSYDADPSSGFPVYYKNSWTQVGGTSAGAPQWAGIAALGNVKGNSILYSDKQSDKSSSYFRDIVSGTNGTCGFVCDARKRFDYVTGLGSPLTANF